MKIRYIHIPDCKGYRFDTHRDVVVNGRGRVTRTFLDKDENPCLRLTCEDGKQAILKSLDILEKIRNLTLIMG